MKLEEILKNSTDKFASLDEAWRSNGQLRYMENGEEQIAKVSLTEALTTTDAPFLFPKVISRTVEEAIEPNLLVVPLLSEVRIDSRSVEIPALGAMQAHDIGEGMPYPEEELPYATRVEGKVIKRGLRVAFTDEMIADSMWDLMGLYLRAAGRALARRKENVALERFWEKAEAVFTNAVDAGTWETTGEDASGVTNGTFTMNDLIDMVAALVTDERSFTHMILHPMSWVIFAKDPVIRNFSIYGSRDVYGGNLVGPGATQEAIVGNYIGRAWPWLPQVILSPYVTFATSTGSINYTDIYTIDANDLGAVLTREDVSTEDFRDPQKDIRNVKLKERYDIIIYGVNNIKVAENVVVAENYKSQ
jgi:hypothetical protein